MNKFKFFLDKIDAWSRHRHARVYLAGVAFSEASFFPIPPDILLIALALAKPKNSFRLAFITTLFSVMGGCFGYLIGYSMIEILKPFINDLGYISQYNQVIAGFEKYGVIIVFLAGFSPIPYKVFTVAAGAMLMPIIPFIAASTISRGLRFYLIAILLYFYGEKIANNIHRHINFIGWTMLALSLIIILLVKFL